MKFNLPAHIDTLEPSQNGVTFPVVSMDGLPVVVNGKPVTITVKGMDSDAYSAAKLTMERTRLRQVGAGLEFDEKTAMAELLANLTVAWTGFEDSEGREAQCNKENALKLYLDWPWVRDLINHRVHNRANFTKASSQSS